MLSGGSELKQNLSKDDEVIFGKSYYNAYITRIFKGESALRKLHVFKNDSLSFNRRHHKAVLYTPSNSGTCGVKLKKGVKYLLSASITRGRIEVTTCDWIAPFHDISRQQRIGINGGYDCQCQLKKCPLGRQCRISDNECEWTGRFVTKLRDLQCDLKHRMCKRLKGKCLWFEDSYYEPCVMQNSSHIPADSDDAKYPLKNQLVP